MSGKWLMNVITYLGHFNTDMGKNTDFFFVSCENEEIDLKVNCFSVTI